MFKPCEICGTEFETWPCRVKIGAGRFCSKKCADKSKLGTHPSIETRRKLSAVKTGVTFTEERKRNISKALTKPKVKYKCPYCGKVLWLVAWKAKSLKCCGVDCPIAPETGRFKKGHRNSTETMRKISEANKDVPRPWFKGVPLSEERKAMQSDKLKGKMPANNTRPGKWMNVKRGYFNIDGKMMFFRSKWEGNYACYLNFLKSKGEIRDWEYEADTFVFEEIKYGTRSYTPDFKVCNNNNDIEYHEVKGWMTPKSKTQLKRMAKYYPKINIVLIGAENYREIMKWAKLYPGWGQEPVTKEGKPV